MSNYPPIPTSWEELVNLKDYLTDCDPSYLRLPDDKAFYELYRTMVPRAITLEILHKQLGDRDVALIQNNFGYTNVLQLLPSVKHYCLWSKRGALESEEIAKIVTEKFPDKPWFFSERKVNHKSVPEIWHAHIFINLT